VLEIGKATLRQTQQLELGRSKRVSFLSRTVLLCGGSAFHLVIPGFRVTPMAKWLLVRFFPFPIISTFSESMMVIQVFLSSSAAILL
jgi:hypothetical protein